MSATFNEICIDGTFIKAESVVCDARKYHLRNWVLLRYSNLVGRDRIMVHTAHQRGSLPCSSRWPFEPLAKKTNSAVPDYQAGRQAEQRGGGGCER